MESFGARLKREREQRKITLDEIAVSTKIGTRFLAAIEEDRFDQLPGGIFNKGFIRAYARHLGMDENQAIADFVAATEPVPPEPPPQEEAPVLAALAQRVPEAKKKSRGDGGIPWGIFAIVLLVLACGFALWGFHSREKPARPSIEAPGPAKPDTSTLTDQKDAPQSVAKLAVPDPAAAQSLPPQPVPAVPVSTAPTAAATQVAADAGLFHVLIKAREDSWIAITADGKQVIQATLAASAEQSIEAREQIVIKAGNVGALEISFNGKKLPAQGAYNQVKTLTFDPNGLRP